VAADAHHETQKVIARETDDRQRPRQAWPANMHQREANDAGSVEVAGVKMAMARQSGRTPTGTRVQTSAPVKTGNNGTVVGARNGLLAAMMREGRTATQVFRTCVQIMVVPTMRAGPLVMMEQRSFHQINGVQEASEAVGAPLDYCPAAALDVSLIAACWSKVNAC
jgi:DDE superfamily endonuclease